MILLILSSLLFSAQPQLSAKREKQQDYKEIISSRAAFNRAGSAIDLAKHFDDLQHQDVVTWESQEIMQERFEILRDERFIELDNLERRISWLYPDDGCFDRAAKFINLAGDKGYELPERIFIFGNLEVQTNNHPSGSVSWWYHTAPIVRVDAQVFVLDPAIDPNQPTPVKDWILKQVPELGEASLAYCSPFSYGPNSQCLNADPSTDDVADYSQLFYLNYEWDRQINLGREPDVVLGDNPPWLSEEVLKHL